MGSLGGVTGVGGGPSLPLNGVREKDKVREAELGKTGFYIFSYSLFYLYCILPSSVPVGQFQLSPI